MPRVNPRKNCKLCGRHRDEVGDLSARGKCRECADLMVELNNTQMHEHAGPFFEHVRLRTLAAWGGVPIESVTER